MRTRAATTPTLALVLALTAICSAALADDQEEARKHFENGLALSDARTKDYQGALVEFQASVELFPTQAGLFNLALCYRRLARFGEALETYDRLLKEFGDELDEELRAEVDRELDAIRRITAELTIEVDQPGATIRVGDERVGRSPLPGPLVLGPREYQVAVTLEGYERYEHKITLVSGESHVEQVALVPLRAELLIETNEVLGATVILDGEEVGTTPLEQALEVDPGKHVVDVAHADYKRVEPQRIALKAGETRTLTFVLSSLEPDIPEEEPSRLSPLFWTGLGLTVAAGATSGAFYGAARSRHSDYEKYNDKIDAAYPTDAQADYWISERKKAEEDTARYQNLSLGFLIGAAVLAAGTTVVLILDLKEDEEEEPVEVTATANGLVLSF